MGKLGGSAMGGSMSAIYHRTGNFQMETVFLRRVPVMYCSSPFSRN